MSFLGAIVGPVLGSIAGGLFSGSGNDTTNTTQENSTTTVTPNVPKGIKTGWENFYNDLNDFTRTGFDGWKGPAPIADRSELEDLAVQQLLGLEGQLNTDLLNGLSDYALNVINSGGLPPEEVYNQLFNQYNQNVTDVTKEGLWEDWDKMQQQINSQAALSGAFGGSAMGTEKGVSNQGLLRALKEAQYQGSKEAHDKAYDNWFKSLGSTINAGNMGINAAQGALANQFGWIDAINNAGLQERAWRQSPLDFAKEQWMLKYQDPYLKKQLGIQGMEAFPWQAYGGTTQTKGTTTETDSGGSLFDSIFGGAKMGSQLFGSGLRTIFGGGTSSPVVQKGGKDGGIIKKYKDGGIIDNILSDIIAPPQGSFVQESANMDITPDALADIYRAPRREQLRQDRAGNVSREQAEQIGRDVVARIPPSIVGILIESYRGDYAAIGRAAMRGEFDRLLDSSDRVMNNDPMQGIGRELSGYKDGGRVKGYSNGTLVSNPFTNSMVYPTNINTSPVGYAGAGTDLSPRDSLKYRAMARFGQHFDKRQFSENPFRSGRIGAANRATALNNAKNYISRNNAYTDFLNTPAGQAGVQDPDPYGPKYNYYADGGIVRDANGNVVIGRTNDGGSMFVTGGGFQGQQIYTPKEYRRQAAAGTLAPQIRDHGNIDYGQPEVGFPGKGIVQDTSPNGPLYAGTQYAGMTPQERTDAMRAADPNWNTPAPQSNGSNTHWNTPAPQSNGSNTQVGFTPGANVNLPVQTIDTFSLGNGIGGIGNTNNLGYNPYDFNNRPWQRWSVMTEKKPPSQGPLSPSLSFLGYQYPTHGSLPWIDGFAQGSQRQQSGLGINMNQPSSGQGGATEIFGRPPTPPPGFASGGLVKGYKDGSLLEERANQPGRFDSLSRQWRSFLGLLEDAAEPITNWWENSVLPRQENYKQLWDSHQAMQEGYFQGNVPGTPWTFGEWSQLSPEDRNSILLDIIARNPDRTMRASPLASSPRGPIPEGFDTGLLTGGPQNAPEVNAPGASGSGSVFGEMPRQELRPDIVQEAEDTMQSKPTYDRDNRLERFGEHLRSWLFSPETNEGAAWISGGSDAGLEAQSQRLRNEQAQAEIRQRMHATRVANEQALLEMANSNQQNELDRNMDLQIAEIAAASRRQGTAGALLGLPEDLEARVIKRVDDIVEWVSDNADLMPSEQALRTVFNMIDSVGLGQNPELNLMVASLVMDSLANTNQVDPTDLTQRLEAALAQQYQLHDLSGAR